MQKGVQMSRVCLYGVGGTMAGSIFDLDTETILIGRDTRQCSIIYPDSEPGVSSVHCQVKVFDKYVEITDLGSRYGTFSSEGVRFKQNVPYRLVNGQSFYVGDKKNKYMVKVMN